MAVVVPIISTFDAKGIDRAIRDFKRLETGGDKVAFGLLNADKAARAFVGAFAKIAAVGAGAAAVIGKNLVDAASALEESQSKVNVVFGASAGVIEEFANKSAVSAGISKQAALEATGTYGNLFQAFGVGREQAADMSVTLVQLASDLASFNNTGVEDAIQALRSGLSGETEPLKRFGVAINDVRLKQEALNLGLYSGKGNLDVAAKSQAAYALILKDTALAQGDFQRTSDGAANQQRILAAQFQNVKAELGTALLPAFKELLTFINDKILPVIQRFVDILGEQGLAAAFKDLGGQILGFIGNLGPMGTTIMFAIGAFAALRAAVIAFTIATNLAKLANLAFGASFAVTPIGLIAAAIAAVIAILAVAYIRFEGFRKVVNFVINAVIGYFEFMTNMWIRAINLVIKGINLFGGILSKVGINIPKLGEIGEVTFGRIGAAADKAKAKVVDFGDRVEQARFRAIGQRIEANKTETETTTTTTGTGKAVKTAEERFKEYAEAIRGATAQQRDLNKASLDTKNAQRDLANATEGVRVAQAQFNLVTQGYPRDSRKAKEAARGLEDANRRLRDATLGQEDAVRRVQKAEQALATLRGLTADPESVAAAERGLQKAKFDNEEAVFRVAEAERELAELRLNPASSAVAIRRGEIALEEAKFRVADAIVGVRDAETKLQNERNKAATAEQLADAERELEDAKRSVEDAIRDQKDATIEQAAAQAFLNQVLTGAKEGSDAYAEALRELNEAKSKEQEAIDKVAEALERERKALLDLIEAQKTLTKLRGETPPDIIRKAEKAIAGEQALALPSAVAAAAAAAAAATAAVPDAAAAAAFAASLGELSLDNLGQLFGNYTPFASGGIVTSPTLGLVGEAGPEAIIPLRDLGAMGGNISITVNAGMGANGPEIGDAIVEALRRWQFRNGALVGASAPLRVA